MGHGGYTLELSLKDSVSAGLKDMGRALSNVRELVALLRADVSALNKASGQAVSGLDLGKLAEGAAERVEGASRSSADGRAVQGGASGAGCGIPGQRQGDGGVLRRAAASGGRNR